MPDIACKQSSAYTADLVRVTKLSTHPNVGLFNHLRGISVIYGNLDQLSPSAKSYVEDHVELCQPESIHICDGSETENKHLLTLLQQQGTIIPLPKYHNCWLARTNPADTARVESKTFICTESRSEAIPTPKPGVTGTLGNWMSPADMEVAARERLAGCMRGRTMYVVPFSMGPVGSPLAKIGIELTDSAYVVVSMRVMTRVGSSVLEALAAGADFVRCTHAVGGGAVEASASTATSWPCDPARTLILHRPATNEIVSYGSGYGGNSLLGKKCLALRIGSTIARREGWLAEHMLILGITSPTGIKRYVVAAFPSACGKTNMAMMRPSLPGYKMECVGDDIAWMRFDATGQLRAINPENGFFGVAPGTCVTSNPHAMATIFANTLFTNVAATSDGGVFWEGLERELDEASVRITDWRGRPWVNGTAPAPAAHPNSRFCAPAAQCPIIDPEWEAPDGVPISAIIFGGRRPQGVPLVYEARTWRHGVFVGAAMRSEATAAAAEHAAGAAVMHDPFAMRPFLGYNFGHYLDHWLGMERRSDRLPKIFHVNWFRRSADGRFLWPGFGDNSRVLDWILRRVDGEECAQESPIGLLPAPDALNLDGMHTNVDVDALLDVPRDFWKEEVSEIEQYFDEQVGADLPGAIRIELEDLKKRVHSM